MSLIRKKKLKNDEDVNPKILEELFEEVALSVPTEDDYRTVRIDKKTVGKVVPTGLRKGEFVVDESDSSTPVLAIRLSDGKMYKIADLTEL